MVETERRKTRRRGKKTGGMMRRWILPAALALLLAAGRLGATTTTASTERTRTAPTRSSPDRQRIEITEDMRAARRLVEPILERLLTSRETDVSVRTWAMAVQSKMSELEEADFVMLPSLLRQLGDRNETVRLTAIQILRSRVLQLEKDEWIGILSPMIMEIARRSPYSESRIVAGKLLSALGKLEEEDLTSLPLLLELTRDDDPEARRNAVEMIEQKIADSLDEQYLRRALAGQAVNTIRTSQYPEVRGVVGELLPVISDLDEGQVSTLFLVFELGRDESEEVRKIFAQTVRGMVRNIEEGRGGRTVSRRDRNDDDAAGAGGGFGGFEDF